MIVQGALKRFSQERLLYRLSANDDAHRWLLKGGALFWLDDDGEGASGIRPTSDIDLHFHENVPMSEVEAVVRHAVGIAGGDGVVLTVGKVSAKIGRASCRERVCQYGYISGGAV